MARGAPDDSNVRIEHSVYRLDDMAELAVRLGSPITYNRFGTVLLLEDFEGGLAAWSQTRNGTGSDVILSVTRSYMGKSACKVLTGTGITPRAGISKYLPPIDECRAGIQLTFSLDTYTTSFDVALTYGSSPTVYYFRIRYTHSTGTLAYYDADGNYTVFATPGVLWDQGGNWHNLKLVVDLEGKTYIRCYLDNVEYTMTDLTPLTASWTYGAFLGPLLSISGNGSVSGTVYLDNVIVTYNEF